MRVRAIREGYGGIPVKFRIVGEEFDVPDGAKGSWFEEVKAGEASAAPAATAEIEELRDRYQKIAGKPPGKRWGIPALKAKLAELGARLKL